MALPFQDTETMWFVVIGTLGILLKATGVALVALSWWWVLSPFVLAALWWWWADATGYTKRRAMDRMDERRAARREKNLANIGLDEKGRRQHRK